MTILQKSVTGPQLVELKDRVVKTFNESNWKELGALTDMVDEVEGHPRILRSLSWGDPDYDGNALTVLRSIISQDPKRQAIVLNYIHRICPPVGVNVSSWDITGPSIVFAPKVFEVPSSPTERDLISVMMPFDHSFQHVYSTIRSAAESSGLRCMRADDLWENSTVVQDVFSLIFHSFIVVCDFTQKNPNVFYEAGIAHTLGKHVVPITQSADDIPFDLRHHRFAKYLNNNEGLSTLKGELVGRFRTLTFSS
jgi:hypothetical protein